MNAMTLPKKSPLTKMFTVAMLKIRESNTHGEAFMSRDARLG